MRAAQAERRERVERGSAPRTEVPERGAAAGYGRPAARIAGGSYAGPAAFLAQLIGQQEEPADASSSRLQGGLAAYRRMTGDDLIVLGPAGSVGLLL